MTRIDRSPDLGNRPSVNSAEEAPAPAAQAPNGVASAIPQDAPQDAYDVAAAVEVPEAVARLGAPRPPSVAFDTHAAEGAEAFAASVAIWGSHLAAAAQSGQPSEPELSIVSGLASSHYVGGDYILPTGNALQDMIDRMQADSGVVWEYGDEEFVRIQTEHRKQEDLRKEAEQHLSRPQRVLKHLPGGVHSVPNPTERNASYELVDASQRVAALVRASLGLQVVPPPLTG